MAVDFKWVIGFLMFESVYLVSGAPVVFGAFGQGYTPSNWVWETLYNVLAMVFYLGMFKERVPARHAVLRTMNKLSVRQFANAGPDCLEAAGD